MPGGEQARAQVFATCLDRPALDAAYRYASLILNDRAEAEDAVHDAALAAWRGFASLRDPERFAAWFGRILVHACRDRLRRRRFIRFVRPNERAAGAAEPEPETPDPSAAIVERSALIAALNHLSVEHREVIVLRFYLDLPIEQIAQRTGTRPGTVKSRLHYALDHLHRALATDAQEGIR